MSSKKPIRFLAMTHDQFQIYLRDKFGEKNRAMIIDELDISSPCLIAGVTLASDIMQRVNSMQDNLRSKFVEKKENIDVPKFSIMCTLTSIQRDIQAEQSMTDEKKNTNKRLGADTSSTTENEPTHSEAGKLPIKRPRSSSSSTSTISAMMKYRRLPDSWKLKAGGEASSFDSDQDEDKDDTFIDPSDNPSIRDAQLSAHHYVMNRLVHHFFTKYLNIDRKYIAQFIYDLQIFRSYSMEHVVEFCRYVRCNADLLSKFKDQYGQFGNNQKTMTAKMKLKYVDNFMTLIKWTPVGFVKPTASLPAVVITSTSVKSKQPGVLSTNAPLTNSGTLLSSPSSKQSGVDMN